MSKFVGFCGPSYNLDSVQFDCQRSVNLYLELDEMGTGTDGNKTILVSTPGKTLAIDGTSEQAGLPIRQVYTATDGTFYCVAGNGFYEVSGASVDTLVITKRGQLLTSTGRVSIADNSGIVWIVDGPNGYTWQTHNNSVGSFTNLIGGSGYTDGTYDGIQVTGGTGTNLIVNVVISSGVVVSGNIVGPGGSGYTVGDVLTIPASLIGGTVTTPFSVQVATVVNGQVFSQVFSPSWQGANFVCVYDSYFLFNVPGTNQFYWSDINSPTFTVAGGSGVDAKQGNSDPIVGMTVFGRIMWLIGSQTTEMWTDNPGGTSTFQRIPGPYIQSGCLAGNTVCFTEYGGMWVAVNNRGGATVVMTPPQGYSVNRISTFVVEQQLQKYGTSMANATAFIYEQKGHIFYQINPPNGTSSWVYDITMSQLVGQPVWHERTFTTPLNQQTRDIADCAAFYNQEVVVVGDYKEPKLYFYNYADYTDNGQLITRMRTTPHISNGFNRIFYNALTIECQTGVGS